MMRTRSWAILCVVLLAAGAGVSACSSSGPGESGVADESGGEGGACAGSSCAAAGAAEDGGSGGTPDAITEAGAGGAGGEAGFGGADGEAMEPSCIPTGPGDLPDDDFADSNCDGIDGDKRAAIFVSPDGKEDNDGSFGSPVNSIGKGIELAAARGKDVYVCTADYPENVVVDTKAVNIFGGYDCVGWSRDNQRASVVPAGGIALTVRNVSAMTVDRMRFIAANATAASESSIAAQIMASEQVVLSHLDLTAGNGASGSSGTPVQTAKQARAGADGNAGNYCNPYLEDWPCDVGAPTGGDGPTSTCGSTQIHGGAGGKAAPYPKGKPQGGLAGIPGYNKSGTEGANGSSGNEGSISKETFGSVTDAGYVASNSGGDGTDGTPGESGGGGNGGYSCHHQSFVVNDEIADCIAGVGQDAFYFGSGGGQGGYGGCGGAAGRGGGAGGASIALLSIKSTVSLSWSSLTTGMGGRGGAPSNGAKGQAGGRGGKAGKPTTYASGSYSTDTTGQDGGPAGDGGAGGPGGPGGGGPSITLVALGEMPVTQAVTFTNGAGGKGAAGFAGRDARSGESAEVKVIQVAPSK